MALTGYQPFHAARAALRVRLGRDGAADDYARAIALSRDEAERNWLTDQAKKNAGHKAGKSNREVEPDKREASPVSPADLGR